MCTRGIRRLLILRKTLVADGRNETLQRNTCQLFDSIIQAWLLVDNDICWDLAV